MDFDELRRVVKEILRRWDHKLIVPASDKDKVRLAGPFRSEIMYINAPYPTVEYIGLELAKEIYESLNGKFKITVKIYEGLDSYAVIEYP